MNRTELKPNPTRFAKDNLNINVASLLTMADNFNFDAPYQRGLVWNDEQKENLITSVVEWVPINAIYWNEYSELEPYEVVDGKQRLTTILDYCNDRFTWKGHLFSELPQIYQSLIKGFSVAIYLTRYKTVEECEELFNRINFSGTPHERKE